MIQITLIRLEGYGPWTATLGSDREHRLQILQSRLYSDMQEQFSKRNGLVFFNRFDEMFAVSNGISVEEHRSILDAITTSYDLNISMRIGIADTPYKAHKSAKMASSAVGRGLFVADDPNKLEGDGLVQIMHIDVDGSTTDVSSRLLPYQISLLVTRLHIEIAERFLEKGSLTFFLGGDNFMVVSSRLGKREVEEAIRDVMTKTSVRLKCGIGIARDARSAAMLATRALDSIREMRKSMDGSKSKSKRIDIMQEDKSQVLPVDNVVELSCL
ncbi:MULTISPECIES: GTP cyclohydrolase IIa [Candidatus Nitrosocaldus]|jgi:GTP cyclohydrolase IIa|uniref:GTP cyclohydrolase III n=1 Tax=Candidatus Nitrosocaldus cavascurensis TaxID=2058097 RepID=A0A2K5ANS0_9ARCH|nr:MULTISPECIES: GTP cyclohydrolase IIa [Candidatus Nitrosocaldus]SPC33249.1 GTP cyclohydrolase III [Candidatus Nitrosocaldus cavascurensis]